MGCACNKNRQNRGSNGEAAPTRETFEVVLNGKVVFKHSSEATAKAVSDRYQGSTVREQSTGRIVHKSEKQSTTAGSPAAT
ncbi:hypothetical protein [Streptomyces sp. NPDC086782]|uniref:hypothetical protein n=1 Tax=Streptomyces sp. NPDC086782 TaxID=3365757 RepID=UPI003812A7CB